MVDDLSVDFTSTSPMKRMTLICSLCLKDLSLPVPLQGYHAAEQLYAGEGQARGPSHVFNIVFDQRTSEQGISQLASDEVYSR